MPDLPETIAPGDTLMRESDLPGISATETETVPVGRLKRDFRVDGLLRTIYRGATRTEQQGDQDA